MISEKKFSILPKCKVCHNKGNYILRARTAEQQDEYGVEAGDTLHVVCSRCRAEKRRRDMFIKNSEFEDPIRYYELSDYILPDRTQIFNYKNSERSVALVQEIISNIKDSLMAVGGFLVLSGERGTGKTITSHIIARESYLQGFMCRRVTIPELSVLLSNKIVGTTIREGDDIVFDLEDYLDADVLIIDQFELINSYFHYANYRRSLVYNIFSGRLKNGNPTIVISRDKINELFDKAVLDTGIPNDFPTVIEKNYRAINLHGKFKAQGRTRPK